MSKKKKCPKYNQWAVIRYPQTLLNSPLDWGRHRLKVTPEIRRTGETFDGGIMIKLLGNHDYEKIGYSLS